MNNDMKSSQMKTCPQCDNHCPADALRCGKGYKYFGVEDAGCGHHDHRDGLGGLIHQCGHFVRHSEWEDEELFQALTGEEKAALRAALEKLLADWKTRCGEESFGRGHHHGRDGDRRRHAHEDQDK